MKHRIIVNAYFLANIQFFEVHKAIMTYRKRSHFIQFLGNPL